MRRNYLLATASSLLTLLAFPNFNYEFLIFFALIPLIFAIEKTAKKRDCFLVGFLAGLVFFAGLLWWLTQVALIAYIMLSLYLALYGGVFALLAKLVLGGSDKTTPLRTLILFPSIWVALEYLRAHLFSGFGWSLLGYSQFLNLPVVQFADITGVWGVSFLIVFINTAIWYSLHCFKLGVRAELLEPYSARRLIGLVSTCIVLLIAVVTYGHYRLSVNFLPGRPFKISVIQGNIPQEEKWDRRLRDLIIKKYSTLTKMAAFDSPDLIIWPETSVPGTPGSDFDLFARVKSLSDEINLPILVGAPVESSGEAYYNSAMLFSPGVETVQRYDKLHLVPFGEFIPAEKKLGFIRRIFPIGNFVPGREFTNLSAGGEGPNFAVLICFEDIFPDLVRRLNKEDCDFLVNITNDAWFGKSSAPYQHAQSSVFRAIENRKSLVRSANTGLSCFIDRSGKITETVHNEQGEEIFITGYRTHTITLSRHSTFYHRHGDLFAFACFLILFIYTATRFINI